MGRKLVGPRSQYDHAHVLIILTLPHQRVLDYYKPIKVANQNEEWTADYFIALLVLTFITLRLSWKVENHMTFYEKKTNNDHTQ